MKGRHFEMKGEGESSRSVTYDYDLDKQHPPRSRKFSRFQEVVCGLLALGVTLVLISHFSLSSSLKGMEDALRTVQTQVGDLRGVSRGGMVSFSGPQDAQCPKMNFYDIGKKYGTDKVTFHHYDRMYDKYLGPRRCDNLVFLEIGLGCNMQYGAGASYRVWLDYFPNSKIYFIEYDGECVKKWEDKMRHDRVKIFVGDQADVNLLNRVIKEVGQQFDFIVDDGGHFMYQQVASFETLFHALKAGGQYFIEDLECSFEEMYTSGENTGKIMLNYVKDIINDLTTRNYIKSPQKVPISSWVYGVDCMDEVCAFTKVPQKE